MSEEKKEEVKKEDVKKEEVKKEEVKKEERSWLGTGETKHVETKPALKVETTPKKEEISWEKDQETKTCEREIAELKDKMAKVTDEWGSFSNIPVNSPYWDYRNRLSQQEDRLKVLKG
jgi:hypothetical protein